MPISSNDIYTLRGRGTDVAESVPGTETSKSEEYGGVAVPDVEMEELGTEEDIL